MLELLHIENIAVIKKADIDFQKGFNVLTGETGAGKSIIIDSILALIGERTSRDIIRTGEKSAVVTGLFSDVGEDIVSLAEARGIEAEDSELSVERRIYADGRNTCRINGIPVTLSILKEIGGALISVHGQHDSRILLDASSHLSILDSFSSCLALKDEYSLRLSELKSIQKKRKSLLTDASQTEQRRQMLEFQINELESLALVPGEFEEMEKKRIIMRESEKIANALKSALAALDSDGGVAERISSAAGFVRIASAKGLDNMPMIAENLENAVNLIRESYAGVDSAFSEIGFSDEEIDRIEDRYAKLNSVRKKYGSIESAIEYLNNAKNEINGLENINETVERLESEFEQSCSLTLSAAELLSSSRKKHAEILEKAVNSELAYLCMPDARFVVKMSRRMREGKTVFSADGIDEVEFYLSANRGEDLKPLSKSASGGELSRIMLAMFVAGGKDNTETVIFDEIDTGISGIAASRVADRLNKLAQERQVLCVTHLSQIAAAAFTHFRIAKKVVEDRTETSVSKLDREGRISELVRINSGETDSEETRAAAAQMLNKYQ